MPSPNTQDFLVQLPQEQRQQIADLTNKVYDLQGKLNLLQAKVDALPS